MKEWCPCVAHDIASWPLVDQGESKWFALGSIECDKYIKVPDRACQVFLEICKACDGTRTASQLSYYMQEELHVDLDIDLALEKLESAGLVLNPRSNKSLEKGEFERHFFKVVELPIAKWSCLLSKMPKGCLNSAFIFCNILIFLGILTLITRAKELAVFRSYLIGDKIELSILASFSIFAVVFIAHELSHSVVAARFGLKPSNLVIGFYLGLTGMIYLKIPGIYTLSKRKKLVLWSAGIYANLVVASTCSLLSYFATSSNFRSLLYISIFVNLGFVLANLSPLLPLDGYYLVSTAFDLPNLRKNAFGGLTQILQNRQNSPAKKVTYTLYLISSLTFMALVLGIQVHMALAWLRAQLIVHQTLLQVFLSSKVLIALALILSIRGMMTLFKHLRTRGLSTKSEVEYESDNT